MPSTFVARLSEEPIVKEHKNLYGKGITPHYAQSKDVVQIVFDNHTLETAQIWLKEHEYPDVELKEVIVEEQAKQFSRNFGYPFTAQMGKFEDTPEGGLRVRGVKLLAAGTWTDSAQKTPCEYSPEILNRFATNWSDNAIWSRHFGGVPRNITEKVGIVENPRYDSDAVVGDLHYHGLTQQSRDTISMIKNGLANYVSVETLSKDKWNPGKKVYQADELGFTGLATVNQGACRVCKIRDNEAVMSELEASVPNNPSGAGIGQDATQCSLTLKDFTDKTWDDLTPAEKSSIASHFAYNDGSDSFGALKLPHHDPKSGDVRPNCVRAALQAIGGARSGTPMDLGGKEKAVQAHLQAHQDEIKKERESETISTEGSLEDLKDAIREALNSKYRVLRTEPYPYINVMSTLPGMVVYEVCDGKSEQKYRVPYTYENDTVTLGEPVDVTVVYKDTNEEEPPKPGAFEEPDMETKELEDLIVKQAETIKELAAKIETIEKTPVPKTMSDTAVEKEYEMPPFQVSFANGIIKRRD